MQGLTVLTCMGSLTTLFKNCVDLECVSAVFRGCSAVFTVLGWPCHHPLFTCCFLTLIAIEQQQHHHTAASHLHKSLPDLTAQGCTVGSCCRRLEGGWMYPQVCLEECSCSLTFLQIAQISLTKGISSRAAGCTNPHPAEKSKGGKLADVQRRTIHPCPECSCKLALLEMGWVPNQCQKRSFADFHLLQ